jgi:hypothetical protein
LPVSLRPERRLSCVSFFPLPIGASHRTVHQTYVISLKYRSGGSLADEKLFLVSHFFFSSPLLDGNEKQRAAVSDGEWGEKYGESTVARRRRRQIDRMSNSCFALND